MKTKQEVIQKAWENWGIPYSEKYVDENGFIAMKQDLPEIVDGALLSIRYSAMGHNDFDYKGGWYRPKSLQGVANNRGWTRIESEADLPQIAGYDFKRKYFTVVDGKIRDDVIFNVVFGEWRMVQGCKITKMNVTHYMDINIPPLPIF